MTERLKVDMIACDGHGVCAELVPELVGLDEWGYPIVDSTPVPDDLMKHARRAVRLCPKLALTFAEGSDHSPKPSPIRSAKRRHGV